MEEGSWLATLEVIMDTLEKRKQFLNKIKEVCEEYGYCISHEDGHGMFQIVSYDEYDMESLMYADYGRYEDK